MDDTAARNLRVQLERDRFVSLADNSPDFIGVCDIDMTPLFVNRAGRRLAGLDDDFDVRTLRVQDFFFPEDQQFVFDTLFPRVLSEGSGQLEVRFRNFRTGEPVWMLYNVFTVKGQGGEPIGFATVSRDVTADVRAREALRAREHRQSRLVQLLQQQRETGDPEAIMAAAAEAVGRELGANRAGFFDVDGDDTLRFTATWTDGTIPPLTGTFPAAGLGAGYLAEVRAGRTLGIADRDHDPLTAGSAFPSIGVRAGIGAPIFRNGRWHAGFYVHQSTVRQWTDEDVAFVRAVADHTWDAVERARAQAALRFSEERFRQMAALTPLFLWVTRGDGVVEYVNERWTEYTGLDLAASGDQANVDALMPAEDRALVEARWAHAFETGEPIEMEVRLRRKDGALRWFLVRTVAQRDGQGRVVRWFTASTDIHAQKEAAQALEEIDRRKDEFLATLSHELRTPLTAGYGWVKLLEKTHDAALLDPALHAIEQSFDTQIRLVDDLLDVSRIVAGKMQIDRQPLDLTDAIQAAVEMVGPAAKAREVELTTQIEPLVMVQGDVSRLTQVVWNLLSNAIKFTPPHGTILLELRRTPDSAELRIRDDGQGIDPAFLPHVFDRFRQADSSISRRQGGLGLGLAIVSSLVEAHGGSVRAESDGLGKGATFTVTLPLLLRSDVPPPPFSTAEELPGDTIGGTRVLVVDDDDGARSMMMTILATAGADVRACRTADEAGQMLAQWEPDVLISDLSMPVEDGYSLVRRIRDEGNEVPAVAVTAYPRTEDAAHDAGFQRHLPKPFAPEDLIAAVRSLTVPR